MNARVPTTCGCSALVAIPVDWTPGNKQHMDALPESLRDYIRFLEATDPEALRPEVLELRAQNAALHALLGEMQDGLQR